ncbi:hypothetical protein FB45DRAFT_351639 [Roridomyces roridus]|uniref:Uncharacterized protein n=1 Tax=Roridomyces roridus TaxID=1738132 RepID=A0AAD7AXD2_9AGAR|nr:hypothetical protein FB45DRAFT_152746 [Roridomyces roridus]KAJ7641004.1 hypothetical protein FB45DRAFT_351639 [Roridomyces roridus]
MTGFAGTVNNPVIIASVVTSIIAFTIISGVVARICQQRRRARGRPTPREQEGCSLSTPTRPPSDSTAPRGRGYIYTAPNPIIQPRPRTSSVPRRIGDVRGTLPSALLPLPALPAPPPTPASMATSTRPISPLSYASESLSASASLCEIQQVQQEVRGLSFEPTIPTPIPPPRPRPRAGLGDIAVVQRRLEYI